MKIKAFNLSGVFLPSLILSVFSLSMLVGRAFYLSSGRLLFLAWNLLLAWLPLLWSFMLVAYLRKNRWLTFKGLLLSFLWLIFLPNSFYLVTDLIHLHQSSPSTLLFDSVMIMSFALAGISLGCASLYLVHKELDKRMSYARAWGWFLGVFILNGVAIFIGRHLRWNSWDLITSPFFIMLDLSNRFIDTEFMPASIGVVLMFSLFIAAIYAAFYASIRAVKSSK